jgi:hypothetical protein
METAPQNAASTEAIERAAQVLAQALASALMEAEVILAADRESRLNTVPPQVIETMERFGDVLTRLVQFNEQLGERISDLTEAVSTLAEARAHEAPRPQLPDMEPPFTPGGEGIDVTIAAVPGFQGLMELQRALVRLPQVQSAAVRRYQDDEAAIQLILSQAMSAATIAEGVSTATNRRLVVDEARPDTLRLRLRFVD